MILLFVINYLHKIVFCNIIVKENKNLNFNIVKKYNFVNFFFFFNQKQSISLPNPPLFRRPLALILLNNF